MCHPISKRGDFPWLLTPNRGSWQRSILPSQNWVIIHNWIANTKDDRGGSVGPDNIDPFLTHIGKTVGNAEDLSLMGIVMLASTHLEPDYSWLFMIILEYLNHENIYQNTIQLPYCEIESSSNGSKLEKDTATHTWFEVEPARCCQPHHRNLRWLVWGWAAVEAPARFHQFHHDPLIHPLIHPIYPSVTSLYQLCGGKTQLRLKHSIPSVLSGVLGGCGHCLGP